VFVTIFAGVVAIVFGPEHKAIVFWTVLTGLVAIILIWAVPRIYVRAAGNRRVQRIRRAMPDALDLMTMGLLPSVFIILWGPSLLELFLSLKQFEGVSSN
ncbi:MAG: hypothetical protein JJ992_00950, partial [Planctomycetes bacterium]|nr:hypothetical protein [Planctomycetota bacterium]